MKSKAAAEAEAARYNKIKNNSPFKIGPYVLPSAYASGGLVDYTGPAWVDGTKKKPEAFLDYEDTRNVAALRDQLREMNLDKPTALATDDVGGNPVYADIKVYVDQLANDLDIMDLTGVVRQEILKASRYRNNVEVTIKR